MDNKLLNSHYDVGIYGWWGHENFGGCLTYFALERTVKKLGYSVLMIQEANGLPGRYTIPNNCISMTHALKEYDCAPQTDVKELYKYNDICDRFIIGGDQMWNNHIQFVKSDCFLDFVRDEKIKISYSTSFGPVKHSPSMEYVNNMAPLLQRFDAISVREDYAVDIAKNIYGTKAQQIIDAVFLPEKSEYLQVASYANCELPKEYLLAFILNPTVEKRKQIEIIAEKLHLEIVCIPDAASALHKPFNEVFSGLQILSPLSVSNFIKAYDSAKYVVTDSFHGTCMSYVFKKDFNVYYNELRGADRFVSLMNLLHLGDRRIFESDDKDTLINNKNVGFSTKWKLADKEVDSEKSKAIKWLKEALTKKQDSLFPSSIYNNGKKRPISADKFNNCIVNTLNIAKSCTGCSSCASICPTTAITMVKNDEGFLNPKVNYEKCINCGLCSKKCIAMNPTYSHSNEPACRAVIANDDIRKASSSGGMFTLVANYVIENHGYVCGAAFDDDFNVNHIIVDNKNDLSRIRGSKYYQSNIGDCYKKIKTLLQRNKMVLFSGMPCQVAGLYSYLGRDFDNLITIDILCHGMSSKKVFDKYKECNHGDKKLKELYFKAKEPWGWHAGVNAYFTDNSHYAQPLEKDPFYIAYLSSIAKNTACGECLFNHLPRQGDFTIGDFWGINAYDSTLNDNKGTSMVLLNSKKSETIFDKINHSAQRVEHVPLKYAIAGNHNIEHPYKLDAYRDFFFKNLDACNFNYLTTGAKSHQIYNYAISQSIQNVPLKDRILFYLASVVAKNYNGRKIVTWIRSSNFERILKQYFGLEVAFGLSMRSEAINGKDVHNFNEIIGNSDEFYLVSLDRDYSDDIYQKLSLFGYKEFNDFVFLRHKPIIIENRDLNTAPYFDEYGNTIEGYGIIPKIVITGWNNHFTFGKNIVGIDKFSYEFSSNFELSIGSGCVFTKETKFQSLGNGMNKITIKNNCHFQGSQFRMFGHDELSQVFIDDNSTFEDNAEFHANLGKKIFIGKDCMFSYNVELWAGDGHAIFDIITGKNINSDYNNLPSQKNYIIIGNHVWVCKSAFILTGTQIGDGSIVGARSVIKGNFPNNCSIAGNPAKIVKKDICWNRNGDSLDINQCYPYINRTNDSTPAISGKNVLVIGGKNLSGKQLVLELIRLGNNVTLASRGLRSDEYGSVIKRIKVDVSNRESCEKAFKNKHFDVVYHDIAYCSNYVKNVLDYVTCDRYIQLSSICVYIPFKNNIDEDMFNPNNIQLVWENETPSYTHNKIMSELAIYDRYQNINYTIVRIPYVYPTDKLLKYCTNIVDGRSMNIDDIDNNVMFVKDSDVGKFLTWIANQEFKGAINFATTPAIKISDIISYIERKTNKKAIINSSGELMAFNTNLCGGSVNLNLSKLNSLHYTYDDTWFWKKLDDYIAFAINKH